MKDYKQGGVVKNDRQVKEKHVWHGINQVGTHIIFIELPPNPRTKRWAVMLKEDRSQQIGGVSWYGSWRKYCFMPMANTVYEQVCLREIADFCEMETKLHRNAQRNKFKWYGNTTSLNDRPNKI